MFSRFRISIALATALSLMLVLPVFAGGWAVITLDELPTGIVAGEPFTVGFTVLQHGRTPMTGLYPTITANLDKETEFVMDAAPEGKPGHYTATLTFPKEGEWRWSIQAFTMDQTMPVLSVATPSVASANQPVVRIEPVAPSIPWLLIVRSLAVVGGLAGMALVFRRRSRWAVALTVTCLLVGAASFMAGSTVPAVEAQSASSSDVSSGSSVAQVDLGRKLFVAKGCITCHYNSKVVTSSEYWTIDIGAPNLSTFSATPEVLRLRLKDPTSVKSDTKMPNLNLSDAEIEALVAFINSK